MLLHAPALVLACGLLAGVSQATEAVNFTVGIFLQLPPARLTTLQRQAAEVSDPESPGYGNYFSQAQLAAAIGLQPGGHSRRAAEWLQAAFRAVNETHLAPHVVAHGDAVTVVVNRFSATYLLGAALVGAAVPGFEVPSLPAPPVALQLVLTPQMPDGFCKNKTRTVCSASPPCRWKEPAESRGNRRKGKQPHCAGAFLGWICWPETPAIGTLRAQWRCFEPKKLEGLNTTTVSAAPSTHDSSGWQRDARKRRRRGRSLEAAMREAPRAAARQGPPELGFQVAPRSEGLLLLVPRTKRNASESWSSVEVSLRQGGRYQTRVLQSTDFRDNGVHRYTVISGLTNLQPVDSLAVCLDGLGAAGAAVAAVAAAAAEPGCACNPATGVDSRLGRRCESLPGISPANMPVDFVVPRAQQTLSFLLRDLGIPTEVHADMPGSSLAVGEFEMETFLEKDIWLLREAYGLSRPRANVTVVGARRPKTEPDDFSTGGEGALDLQVASVVAPKAPITWWLVSEFDLDGFVLAYAVQVNDAEDPPLVHSISWGDAEALFPPVFVERLDYEIMKLVLRGITVLVASGDNGISSINSKCAFVPDLLGSSPWATSVGATQPSKSSAPFCSTPAFRGFMGPCDEPGPITCSVAAGAIITSSGYWSLYRGRPSYQDEAVQTYLRDVDCAPCVTSAGTDNRTELGTPCQHLSSSASCALEPLLHRTRVSPDVALPGNSYPTMVNGSLGLFDGTSASSPALAAMISLLNAEQHRRGQPPLGFLNPWLYSVYKKHPGAFTDVVVGDTGSTVSELCAFGFRAGPGWDPATGLGVPRLDALIKLLPSRGAAAMRAAAAPEEMVDAGGQASFAPRSRVAEAVAAGLLGAAAAAVALATAGAALWRQRPARQATFSTSSATSTWSAEGSTGYRALLGSGTCNA